MSGSLCEDRLLRADLRCGAGSPQLQGSGAPPSKRGPAGLQQGYSRATAGLARATARELNEGGAILKGGSVGSKKEKVIERARDNISTVTFPALWTSTKPAAQRGRPWDHSGYGR